MATIWKSATKANTNHTYSGTKLSSWSRQQKIAMIATFVMLGFLLAFGACSKQSQKPAQVGVSSPASTAPVTSAATPAATTAATSVPPVAPKKVHKKRPLTVTYNDPNSGVSFRYPRKYEFADGGKAQSQFDGLGPLPMNFVQPGGAPIVTVAMPKGSYPGTDFSSAFFNVNVNRSLSEEECSHFAFVDARDPDGKPVEAEKVKVGSMDLEKTTDFAASARKQAEAQYYHRYENGACYEFVLGLGTAGYDATDGIEPVDRDQVFARLEKILATVKIQPVAQEQVATKVTNSPDQAPSK
jgi:hypothetical protein